MHGAGGSRPFGPRGVAPLPLRATVTIFSVLSVRVGVRVGRVLGTMAGVVCHFTFSSVAQRRAQARRGFRDAFLRD